jgi:hypothetical protein
MVLFKTRSAAVYGIDAHLIDVEVEMYASLINSGFGYPNKGVTINLAPARYLDIGPRCAHSSGYNVREPRHTLAFLIFTALGSGSGISR